MGLIVKPNTFVNGGAIIGSQWTANFSTWIAEFNGNLDNANFAVGADINGSKFRPYTFVNGKLGAACVDEDSLDYTNVLLNRAVAAGYWSTQGIHEFTMNGASPAFGAATVSFATESNIQSFPPLIDPTPFDTGDPAFAAAPRVTLGIEMVPPTISARYTVRITAINSASFTFSVRSSVNGDTSAGKVHWRAIGIY